MGKRLSQTNKKYWKRKCQSFFSEIIRNSGRCVLCNKKEVQCSHVIPVSASKALEFDLQNAIPLCMKHHLYWWHKNPIEATEWFKEKYPDRYKYLNKHKQDIVKRSFADYKELYGRLKDIRDNSRKTG